MPLRWTVAARRIDVHATDHFAGAGVQHGVGEPAALGEVLCVAFEIVQVSAMLIGCGQPVPANPGVAWMWSLLAVHAA